MKLIIFTVLSLAVFANAFSTDEINEITRLIDINLLKDFPVSDELIDCVKDELVKIYEGNRDLDWWFNDIKDTSLELLEQAFECAVKSGLGQDLCFLKLKGKVDKAVDRILNDLPEEKKGIMENLKQMFYKCIP